MRLRYFFRVSLERPRAHRDDELIEEYVNWELEVWVGSRRYLLVRCAPAND